MLLRTSLRILCVLLLLYSFLAPAFADVTGPSPTGVREVAEADVPATCIAGRTEIRVIDADDADCAKRICRQDGLGFRCAERPSQTLPALAPAFRLSAGGLDGEKHTWTTWTTSQPLGLLGRGCAIVGTNGITLTLPDAATAPLSDYEIMICDTGTGSLTLAPAGTDTIADGLTLTGTNTARTIQGKYRFFVVRLINVGDTNWRVESALDPQQLGLPTRLCTLTGGDTNNSSSGSGSDKTHSLSCAIPANRLTANMHLQSCAQWRLVTGASAPTLALRLQIGGTTVAAVNPITIANNLGSRVSTLCYDTLVLGNPGASVNTTTSILTTHNDMDSATHASITAQPVARATNGALAVTFLSQWGSPGTGTNTAELLGAWVEIAR